MREFFDSIDAAPERLARLPVFHGVDGADLLAIVMLVCAFWMLYSLIEERHRKRIIRAVPPALSMKSWEYTRAHVGTNYSSHTVDAKRLEGWEPCSDVDPRYGSIWMRRPLC